MQQEIMTAEEVAQFLRVPVATLYQWRYRGLGPRGARIGRHLRYRRADIERYLDEQATPAGGGSAA